MKKEIYVLEDDDDIGEMIQYLLEEQGYSVSTFSSVSLFNLRITHKIPDLVILDIWLPDGNGRAVCRQLRARQETSELPIILMTANSVIEKVPGANDFIPKPFDVNDFVTRVGRLIEATEEGSSQRTLS